jgi:hypothetical protein
VWVKIVIKELTIRPASSVSKHCTTGVQKWSSTRTLYNIIIIIIIIIIIMVPIFTAHHDVTRAEM